MCHTNLQDFVVVVGFVVLLVYNTPHVDNTIHNLCQTNLQDFVVVFFLITSAWSSFTSSPQQRRHLPKALIFQSWANNHGDKILNLLDYCIPYLTSEASYIVFTYNDLSQSHRGEHGQFLWETWPKQIESHRTWWMFISPCLICFQS